MSDSKDTHAQIVRALLDAGQEGDPNAEAEGIETLRRLVGEDLWAYLPTEGQPPLTRAEAERHADAIMARQEGARDDGR